MHKIVRVKVIIQGPMPEIRIFMKRAATHGVDKSTHNADLRAVWLNLRAS